LNIEAAKGALTFCFDGLSLHRVQGFCDGEDTANRQMFEKANMRREGEFVRNRRVLDRWTNTLAYAILREEFQKGAPQ
jgi:RimJ/RimL family protein N-acetyltransferase